MQKILLAISLAISVLGIFFLLILTNFSQVSTQGRVISIKSYDDFKIIKLDSNKTITCDSCQVKLNQTIQVQGKIQNYQNQPQVSANKIQVLKKC